MRFLQLLYLFQVACTSVPVNHGLHFFVCALLQGIGVAFNGLVDVTSLKVFVSFIF